MVSKLFGYRDVVTEMQPTTVMSSLTTIYDLSDVKSSDKLCFADAKTTLRLDENEPYPTKANMTGLEVE